MTDNTNNTVVDMTDKDEEIMMFALGNILTFLAYKEIPAPHALSALALALAYITVKSNGDYDQLGSIFSSMKEGLPVIIAGIDGMLTLSGTQEEVA